VNVTSPVAPVATWGYRAVGAAVFLTTLAVYTITLTPSCPFWDSGEFIATSQVLGIPHPPGTPLYVLIGRLFAMVPVATVAVRVNWLSALASALAVLFTFLLTVRLLRYTQGGERTGADEVIAWTGGACAAFFVAFSNTFWESAIEAEVYALSSWMQVFILYLGVKWWEGLERGEGDNRLLVAWYLCFLCVSIHLGTFLVMPSLVLLVLMVNWRSLLSPRNLAWAVVLAGVGLSVHFYLYLRAHANPPINEGDPETWQALKSLLMRDQYGSRPMLPRSTTWAFQFGMFFRYFFEQYVLHAKLGTLGGTLPVAIGLFGAVLHGLRHRKTFAYLGLTVFLTTIGLLVYLNFTDHEVRERDYFYSSGFHFYAIWIGMGLAFLLEWLRERWALLRRREALGLACLAAVGVSLLPMVHHWYTHDRRGYYVASDYAHNMLAPLAKDSFIFTNGDNDTFPLWYIQQVENFRKDVRVINLSLLNTDWYIRQLRDEAPRVPMVISDAETRLARDYGYLPNPKTGEPELVNHRMVHNILEANQGRRVPYFAVTVPDHHGLDPRMVFEGLVLRIEPEGYQGAPGVVPSGRSWMDSARVRQNIYETFRYRNLFDADGNFLARPYKDDNSRRLTQNYASAHMQLAYAYRREGRHPQAVAEVERVLRMFPEFPQVEGVLGVFYLDAGDTARALAYFRDRERTRPTSDLLYYYGVTLNYAGQVDSAVAKFLRAGELDPQEVQAYKAAYMLLMERGRRREADGVLEIMIRKHPDDPEIRAYLGLADTAGRGSWAGGAAGPAAGAPSSVPPGTP
jgi:tetratricopeptide (TPR) repeat protein